MKRSVFILISFCLAVSCRNSTVVKTEEEVNRVRITSLRQERISIPVHTNGILSSEDEIKLSFKTGGIIERINVSEGERVLKGRVLATLNLSEISAAVTKARNGYEKALRDNTRAGNLYRDSVATLEMKQNSETALDVARSDLQIAEFNLNHSTIKAPSDGVILKQLARQNELISQGYPVFLFGSSGKYWKIRSGLSDRDVVKINPGDSAEVSFDAWPLVKFRAVVDRIGEMADPYTGTFEVEMLVDGGEYRLASGFVATVNIFPAAAGTYPVVPVGSVVDADGRTGYVYLLTDSGTVSKQRIEIIHVTGDKVAISGIRPPGPQIVSEGAAWLRDGMKVKVVNQ